jgi:hypothetical protein
MQRHLHGEAMDWPTHGAVVDPTPTSLKVTRDAPVGLCDTATPAAAAAVAAAAATAATTTSADGVGDVAGVTGAALPHMPLLGASMHNLKGISAAEVVTKTLRAGYKLIDTARVLRNEDHIGDAIKVTDTQTRPSP